MTRKQPPSERHPSPPLSAAALIDAALERRAPLLSRSDTSALRLLNGEGDGVAGLVVEKFERVLIAQLHQERLATSSERVRELCESLMRRVGADSAYRKDFGRDRSYTAEADTPQHRDPRPWLGAPAPEEFTALEGGMRLRIRPYDGYSVGLFLDQRDNRQQVRAMAAGRRVLNLFAYTCGFSVAAGLGGAAEVVNVDVSRKALEWGRRNVEENGLALAQHIFLRADALGYLARARRQGRTFEVVILDPPTFARDKEGRAFSLASDLTSLVRAAQEVAAPGAVMLLSVNHRATSWRQLEDAVRRGPASVARVERGRLPIDFPGDPDYSKSLWAWLK